MFVQRAWGVMVVGAALAACGRLPAPAPATPDAMTQVSRSDTAGGRTMRLQLQVSRLLEPEQLAAGACAYVVWAADDRGQEFTNLGRLTLDRERTGRISAVVPRQRLRVLVTPERDARARRPGARVVFETEIVPPSAARVF
jgi:hypothetical protein